MNPRFSGGFIFTVFKEIAMKRTTNYALPTWEKSDFIQMSDFNDLTQKTDAALKANADAAQVLQSGKADAQTVSALAKNLGTAGHNCRIAVGSYTGQGHGGQDNPVVFNCPFYPVLLFMKRTDSLSAGGAAHPALFLRGDPHTNTTAESTSGTPLYVSWADSSITWYAKDITKPSSQFDDPNATYLYVIVGYDKTAENVAEQAAA